MSNFNHDEFKVHFRNFALYQLMKNAFIFSKIALFQPFPNEVLGKAGYTKERLAQKEAQAQKAAKEAKQRLDAFRPALLESLAFLKRISGGYNRTINRPTDTHVFDPGDDIPPIKDILADCQNILFEVQEELRYDDQ